MKEIKLTKGFTTIVDDADYPALIKYKWHAYKDGKYGRHYAVRRISGNNRTIYMHNEIINAPKGMYVDHRDGDSLNNQRENLRIANGTQNGANRKISETKRGPQYLGVHMRKTGKFYACSNKDRVRYYTPNFETVEEAANAYNELATRLHGEFARLNIVPPLKEPEF